MFRGTLVISVNIGDFSIENKMSSEVARELVGSCNLQPLQPLHFTFSSTWSVGGLVQCKGPGHRVGAAWSH